MSVVTHCCYLLLLISCVNTLIIPDELPSILSVIYSNIPPIKKGTDSRMGVGFRLGNHADFQVLLELGPQSNTQAIGPAADSKKRRQVVRPALVVQPVAVPDTVADTPGGKWLSSWRSALINPQTTKSSKYKTVEVQEIVDPMQGKDHIRAHLQQLYQSASKTGDDARGNSSNKEAEETVNNRAQEGAPTKSSTTEETSTPEALPPSQK
ncbi:uncharacterized protein snsl [Periplaneta americana]|uniref:uncharacterized protein snsl n=1 Tax=Periplaneta americana TaxID=6978 RepID=UPI0037E94988